jgi:FtsZ-binding cell division protein ZapB
MQVNIYLPKDLADKIRVLDGLNVSQICQQALQRQVDAAQARSDALTDLEQAAVRLRESHGDWQEELTRLGAELGSTWAKEEAHWADLVLLDDERRGIEVDAEAWAHMKDSAARYVEKLDRGPVRAWDDAEDPFVEAFFQAATDTFRSIRKLM